MSNDNGESDNTSTESGTTRTGGSNPHGSWEIPETSPSSEADRSEKARFHNADMYVAGKSDSLVVPGKRANNAGPQTVAESVEERGLTKENANQPLLVRTQSRVAGSRGLLGVRVKARQDKKARFNNLLNHITPELLRASFFDLKKTAAPGIDGETWAEYAVNFEARIIDLHSRIHRGTYRAQPSKRTWIPKLDGKLRPLGIAALEDKIAQQAVRVVLEWKRLSALCSGPVGGVVAETPCLGRSHHRPVRGRFRSRFPRRDRCTTLPRSTQGTVCQVSSGTAPREDSSDRVRPLCGRAKIKPW